MKWVLLKNGQVFAPGSWQRAKGRRTLGDWAPGRSVTLAEIKQRPTSRWSKEINPVHARRCPGAFARFNSRLGEESTRKSRMGLCA